MPGKQLYSKALIILITISFVFNSCKKENSYDKRGSRIFTDEQITQIGKLHNDYLEEVISKFNLNTVDYGFETQHLFNNLDLGEHRFDWTKEYGNIDEEKKFLKENLSAPAFDILILATDEAKKIVSVKEYSNYITSLEIEAHKKLSGIDLEATLIALTVFKNSAYFWLSADEEGSGIGYNFVSRLNESQNRSLFMGKVNAAKENEEDEDSLKDLLKLALAADGLSAAGGFLVGAFVIAATATTAGLATPAIIGFLVGIAGEAALSSAAAVGLVDYLNPE